MLTRSPADPDGVLDAALHAAGDPPSRAALQALAPALQRLALQRLADRAVPPGAAPVAVGHRTAEILALAEGGALDVGGGLRAHVRDGRVAFVASTGPAAPHRDRAAS